MHRVNVTSHVLGAKCLDRLYFAIFIVQPNLLRGSAGGIHFEIVERFYYKSGMCCREHSIEKIASVRGVVHSEIEPKELMPLVFLFFSLFFSQLQDPQSVMGRLTGPPDPGIPHQRAWQSQLMGLQD